MRHSPSFTTETPTAIAQPPAQTPAPAAPKTGVKKLSFGKIAARKTEDTTSKYPVFEDANGQVGIIAARIKRRKDELDALEGALNTDKAELKMIVAPFYFRTNAGKTEIPSSVSVQSPEGEVLVTFANRYPKLADENLVLAVLGEELTAEYFQQQAVVTINFNQVPGDTAQEFLEELQQLAAKYRTGDALEVKDSVSPIERFHNERHRRLTSEQNLALEEAYPITAMIKTKGRNK